MPSKRITSQVELMEQNPVLIFLHLPRTGGTTLTWMIKERYTESLAVGDFQGEKMIFGSPISLHEMKKERREDIDIVVGHSHYGIHSLLREPALYITLLRDPVDRAISHYYYIKERVNHPLYTIIRSMSLIEFINDERFHPGISNVQTKFLSGNYILVDAYGIKRGPVRAFRPSVDVDRAVNALKRHFLYGITEQFDRSIKLFQRVLGWTSDWYKWRRVSQRPPIEDESLEVIQTLESLNKLDRTLYEYATENFEAICKDEGI